MGRSVHYRGFMDLVHISGPWTHCKVRGLVHVLDGSNHECAEPIINVIKICGIGIWMIFHTVFRYLPFFLMVLQFWVPPNVPIRQSWTNVIGHFHFWGIYQFTQVQSLYSPHKQCWTYVSTLYRVGGGGGGRRTTIKF